MIASTLLSVLLFCAYAGERDERQIVADREQSWKLLIDAIPGGVFRINSETYEVIMANPSIEKTLGYDSLIGVSALDLIPAEYRQDHLTRWNDREVQRRRESRPIKILGEMRRKDGSRVYSRLRIVGVDNRPYEWLVFRFPDGYEDY